MGSDVSVWFVAAAAIPAVLALVLAVVLWVRVRRLRAEQRLILPDGAQVGFVERQAALARTLERLGEGLDGVRADVTALSARVDAGLRGALRFQGIVRYDAYSDMGGAQSWSMAILNADRTGAVVTSLHARDHARVYLKELVGGVSAQRLSPEEERAVAAAMGGPGPVQERP